MTAACAEAFAKRLIDTLEADGILSGDVAAVVRDRYLASVEQNQGGAQSLSQRLLALLSLANFAKVVAIICLLCAVTAAIPLITPLIPVEVLQVPLLILAIVGSFWPELLWASQAVYVAIFSVLVACNVGYWIVSTHEPLQHFFEKLIDANWPLGLVLSVFGMLLFGVLAVRHTSQLLGLISTVHFSAVLGFAVFYMPEYLLISDEGNSESVMIYGHMAAIAVYLFCKHKYLKLRLLQKVTPVFGVGVEYYCTIAMGLAFAMLTSPWEFDYDDVMFSYRIITLLVFIATLSASMYVYFFLGTKTIGSILCVSAALVLLDYLHYFCTYAGYVFTMAAMAVALYGCALLLERYRDRLVFRLNSEPEQDQATEPLLDGECV